MIEWILQGAQQAHNMGLVGLDFVVAVALGGLGYQLYSGVREPTDAWDEFLKGLSIGMMVLGVIDFLVIVIRLM